MGDVDLSMQEVMDLVQCSPSPTDDMTSYSIRYTDVDCGSVGR